MAKPVSLSATRASIHGLTKDDPYQYAAGFGNRFESEAIPGVLPFAQNQPQKVKYGLYHEGLTGSSFVAPRPENMSAMLYRILPSVAHQGFVDLPDIPDVESNFLPSNHQVKVSPTQLAWSPLDIPDVSEKVDFMDGLKTIAGGGCSMLREGLAIHMYLANASMGNKAFVNNDGDMLMMPQQGRMDIQTEFGKMMVRPGELVVIQRGMKFKVGLPDGPSRGYVQEIFGGHYQLPELGPLGGHGLANPRDFEVPVASFDIDQSPWQIVCKLGGKFFSCSQDHTPFDVVAWHGNYVPYKYDMKKFIFVGSISKDHIDPSVFCVLTAKSQATSLPFTDVLVFGERWDVADQTFRPPYYHRNISTEFIGIVMGEYEGRSGSFVPGSMSHETVFCPHGVSHEEYQHAAEHRLVPQKIHTGIMAIMFETSMILSLTDYALNKTSKLHGPDSEMWNRLSPEFLNHLGEVNTDLLASGLLKLPVTSAI